MPKDILQQQFMSYNKDIRGLIDRIDRIEIVGQETALISMFGYTEEVHIFDDVENFGGGIRLTKEIIGGGKLKDFALQMKKAMRKRAKGDKS